MGLLETSLEVVKLATRVANPELVQAATRANIEALELSAKNLALQKQVTELGMKITELEQKLTLTGEVFREGDFVFQEGDPIGCCSRCWDAERKLIHIIDMDRGSGRGMGWGCPECKTLPKGRARNPHMR